jgi:quercetin dioxygenase-like cupin family protein
VRALLLAAACAALCACAGQRRPPPPVAEGPLGVVASSAEQLEALLAAHPLGAAPLRLDRLARTSEYSVHLAQMRAPMPRHLHRTHHERTRVVRGRGTVEIDGRTYPALPGTSFHIVPGTPHSAAPDEGEVLVAVVLYAPPMETGNEDRVAAESR